MTRILSLGICLYTMAAPVYCPAQEVELYFTDFEDAPTGDDQLVGYDRWNGTSQGSGSHGINEAAAEGIGRSAFIGEKAPQQVPGEPPPSSVTVLRPVAHDPIASGKPVVHFTAAIGINDSDNVIIPESQPPRDLFFITIANGSGKSLASLNYNNTVAGFGLWRDDGVDIHDTGEEFIRNEIQLLFAEIDFSTNTWSVELDGFLVFRNAPLTARTDIDLNLGAMAIVWQRAEQLDWGNNWMLFDDWTISAVDAPLYVIEEPFEIDSVARQANGQTVISWLAQPGYSYYVEYSNDMVNWVADLPDSAKVEPAETLVSHTDTTSGNQRERFYRVVRSPLN